MAFPRLAWRLRWALLAPVVAAMVAAMPLFIFALIAGPVAERELVVTLGLAALVGTLAAIVTAWWLRRVLVAPLDAVLAGVERLASGDFAFRLQQSSLPEITALSEQVNMLAERFRQEVARQAESAEEIREILEALPDGVLVVRGGGRTGIVNRAFYQLMRTDGAVADAPVLETVRHPVIRELVHEAGDTTEIVERTLELDDRRGQRRFLVARGRALPRRDAVVVVVRDVTEAARVEAMRRDFVANLSHELKTPLAAVRGYAESLEDGALADPGLAPRFLAGILSSTARLEALLADLLTLARMEGVGITEVLETVDVGELVLEVVDAAQPRIATKGLALSLEVEPGWLLMGDRKALERMVSNLVENAISYNREGGSIAVRLETGDQGCTVSVEDSGVGIPTSALSRIFERFYRVDRGRTRAEGGTGLGLSIVRHAALRHGGRVEVTSREGQGSTFRVVLPRGIVAKSEAAAPVE